MSGFTSFASSGGSPSNPDITYEPLGFDVTANGGGTAIAASAVTNTKGSYITLGTTAAAWCAFIIEIGNASASAGRFLFDVRVGGATVVVPDFYIQPGTTGSATRIRIPIAVGSGQLVEARCQSSTASASFRMTIIGIPTYTGCPPGFTTMTAINPDTTNTRPDSGAVDVPLTNTWTQVKSATAGTYGALLVSAGDNGTSPATAQNVSLGIGVGAAASEVEIVRFFGNLGTTNPLGARFVSPLIEKTIASGARVSARAYADTPGTDNIRVGLYGFS